ncbi:hypothetical protein [Sandaracinus amylolyticus]|uniref:hypothetical protein n=1 Tax=Sandaracinus amylolyticus TaxID=927083 RepID=UPI001F1828A5|nr:hypothetical protein [Sandaracinus amylolyticus]UJR86522.1 Hypothetical protein I5071_86170 [Sandaracinus amylolyticus]
MKRALVIVVLSLAGCGPDARRVDADATIQSARAALMQVEETSGGEEALRAPLERSREWLERSEEGVEVWGSSGSLAYETAATCLGVALGQLRDALVARGHDVPTDLEEAEAGALAASERPCATRR